MTTSSDWARHTYETRPWRQQVTRGPRADKLVREITVSHPPRIAELDVVLEPPLAAMTAAVAGDLRKIDLVHGRTMDGLNELQLRTESVDSSKIENVEASLADYGRALLGVGANASALSMADATAALSRMIADADSTRKVRAAALLDAHRDLFAHTPSQAHNAGRFRTRQNWVGGSDYSPRGALHVPPPPEEVPALLEDLLAFANRDDVPILAQAAIVHAQFESIHPFIDGNGRIGRTLIHAVIRRRRGTRNLTVPIASALVAHRERYFAALSDYRNGQAHTIIAMLASATSIATAESWRTAETIASIRDRWQATAGAPVSGTPTSRLLDLLTEEPIVNEEVVLTRLGVPATAVRESVEALLRAGVLTRASKSRRSPVWLATDVLSEIQAAGVRIQAASRALQTHA